MKKQQSKSWSEEELNFLRFAYPRKDFTTREICDALNRGRSSISTKASSLGIKRPLADSVPDGYKKCSKCNVIALLSDFNKSKKNKDGLDSWCKYCKSKRRKEQALTEHENCTNTNTKQALTEHESKSCKICGVEKQLNDFPKNHRMKDGYENQCKICRSKLNRKRYIKGAY